MGAYLSEPKTTKDSSDHEGEGVRCGASSMQGWRISQEVSTGVSYQRLLLIITNYVHRPIQFYFHPR